MNVTHVAHAIGIDPTSSDVTGTIDETVVLRALADLAEADPANDDLFSEASARVQRARSAGFEEFDSRSIGSRQVATTQLRYRSEMAGVFTDLVIDVELRRRRDLVAADELVAT